MKTIADQIFVTLGLPLDSRLINISLNSNIITIETIEEYLNRVDIGSRYLGMSPIIYEPAGEYDINDFLTGTTDGTIYKNIYIFENTIEDIGLVPISNTSESDPVFTEWLNNNPYHSHDNKDTLDKFSEDNGILLWNLLPIQSDDASLIDYKFLFEENLEQIQYNSVDLVQIFENTL